MTNGALSNKEACCMVRSRMYRWEWKSVRRDVVEVRRPVPGVQKWRGADLHVEETQIDVASFWE